MEDHDSVSTFADGSEALRLEGVIIDAILTMTEGVLEGTDIGYKTIRYPSSITKKS